MRLARGSQPLARRLPVAVAVSAAQLRAMADDAASSALPEATFLNFLSGLASQALMQFGEIPNPHTGQRQQNLPFAAYTVQIIRILRDKTEGNRTDEESQYLTAALEDLEARLAQSEG